MSFTQAGSPCEAPAGRPNHKQQGNLVFKAPGWRAPTVRRAKTDSIIDGLMRHGLDHVFAEHKINRGAADA
jgi:hypothetical protein